MMAKIDFVNQLKELGFDCKEPDSNKVQFEYVIPAGKNNGKKVLLGFENIHDFPMNAPHGPHFYPIDQGWVNPSQGVHQSNFGVGWFHWSRPFKEWNKTKRTVKEYMAHLINLFISL
jgi:hypothetical protein